MEKNDVFFLRPAVAEDADLLYRWRNDPAVRKNSFQQEEIPYAAHLIWFRGMMENVCRKQYICMERQEGGEVPVGQLRLDQEADGTEISYSVAAEARGRGVGTAILALAISRAEMDFPEGKRLFGRVKQDNPASASAFLKNGFLKHTGNAAEESGRIETADLFEYIF